MSGQAFEPGVLGGVVGSVPGLVLFVRGAIASMAELRRFEGLASRGGVHFSRFVDPFGRLEEIAGDGPHSCAELGAEARETLKRLYRQAWMGTFAGLCLVTGVGVGLVLDLAARGLLRFH